MRPLLITIDGPSGAGKTTVSKRLAGQLGYQYMDTGALYRAVAFEAVENAIGAEDETALEKLCRALRIRFETISGDLHIISGGKDITEKIRTPRITMMASAVSAKGVVRKKLLDIQQDMGRKKRLVADGRDMGTVVFPDADIKFFLDASASERARRRFEELDSTTGQTLDQVEKEMNQRDRNDTTRALAPLKPAADAVIIDSTGMSVAQVTATMLAHIKKIK